MLDDHYPDVEIKFLHETLLSSPKIVEHIKNGKTNSYLLEGTSYIGKRTINIRDTESGSIPFEKATGIAIKAKCFDKLLKYLEENRNFKDGGYTEC